MGDGENTGEGTQEKEILLQEASAETLASLILKIGKNASDFEILDLSKLPENKDRDYIALLDREIIRHDDFLSSINELADVASMVLFCLHHKHRSMSAAQINQELDSMIGSNHLSKIRKVREAYNKITDAAFEMTDIRVSDNVNHDFYAHHAILFVRRDPLVNIVRMNNQRGYVYIQEFKLKESDLGAEELMRELKQKLRFEFTGLNFYTASNPLKNIDLGDLSQYSTEVLYSLYLEKHPEYKEKNGSLDKRIKELPDRNPSSIRLLSDLNCPGCSSKIICPYGSLLIQFQAFKQANLTYH